VVTVADCERVQADWYRYRAEQLGGAVSRDGALSWVDGPDGPTLLFPDEMSDSAVVRGVERAGGRAIGAWLSESVDPAPLERAGFERGWAPWWMVADLEPTPRIVPARRVAPAPDPRVELQTETSDYGGEHAAYAAELRLTRLTPRRTWYAAAYEKGRFAGRAWSFLSRDKRLAGVFDMAVWPPFRRRGLGTGLLTAVCAAACAAGARYAVLNATPEGKLLYETCGFHQIGAGITYWRPEQK
jgi:GNAT superfamily N-acetyltransferase